MLNLCVKIGESVFIAEDIEMKILGVQGKTVNVGFNAPREITILREKLVKALKKTHGNENENT